MIVLATWISISELSRGEFSEAIQKTFCWEFRAYVGYLLWDDNDKTFGYKNRDVQLVNSVAPGARGQRESAILTSQHMNGLGCEGGSAVPFFRATPLF